MYGKVKPYLDLQMIKTFEIIYNIVMKGQPVVKWDIVVTLARDGITWSVKMQSMFSTTCK